MLKGTRSICLDVCDYENNVICNLYDNTSDISGQATDVFVRTERNGWKELSFSLPYTCTTYEGVEENYRLQYLIADYRIRLKTDNETDWYLISEPKINHNAKAKTVDIVAGHISQLLKTKNLNLEFSDEEGNNVGTAEQLLTTILDGTGWSVGNVAEFYEDDGETIKVRSITASTKTGAFMLISTLCEKFDAKPIYHGDGRIVDIVPMNPFSEVQDREIPKEVMNGETVLELNYGYNISDMSRTLNTENIVTRLYAYGSYGDKTNGLCSLQTVEHNEYTFTMAAYSSGTEFKFSDKDGINYYFTATTNIVRNNKLIWSDMDQTSRTYIWNDNQNVIYRVYKEPKKTIDQVVTLSGIHSVVKNRFDYLMDFNYYDQVGLLTDNMLLEIAKFQRKMPAYIDASTEASTNYLNAELELSRAAESNTGFLRLDVKNYVQESGGALTLVLNKSVYPDGVIYRSDYDEARRNYFSWYCAEALKDNGDPTSGIGSVVYIIHNTNPITWQKAYVKMIDYSTNTVDYSVRGTLDPSTVTLWINKSKVPNLRSDDRFYLFSTNSISGRMGTRESEIESLQQTLQQATKVVTEEHPTYFVWDNDAAPNLNTEAELAKTGYGWYYRAFSNGNAGELYFCYGVAGESTWHRALFSETVPSVINGGYFFNLKTKHLFHGEGSSWVDIATSTILVPTPLTPSGEYYTAPTTESKRLSQAFSQVAYYCSRYDMLHKGLYDKYTYTATSALPPGNYAFKNDYGFYWVFSTDLTISKNSSIWLDTIKYLVYQTADIATVVKPEAKPYEAIDFPVANELSNTTILQGNIVKTTGAEENTNTLQRTNHMPLYANVVYRYSLPSGSFVVFYDQNRRYLSSLDLSTSGTFTTGPRVKYARFVFKSVPTSSQYIRVDDYSNKFFVKEKQYTVLSPLTTSGDKSGMLKLVKDFADTADSCYLTYLKAFKNAQAVIKTNDDALKDTLGDLYREGYWQKNEYVEGDEVKLYKDTLDNLEKISKPEATYDFTFLDLYSSNKNIGFSVDDDLEGIEWPDIQITDAVHLIDETIDVNCWAFIDTINKCYDQPWRTEITINTDLSLIAQHSFTDVLSRIAEVANETSARQTIYNRASAISGTGRITAERLEGTININNNLLKGGSSNWYTDNKGNIIFESTDGQSAMMLTGYGWAVANSKNSYGDWDFRYTTTGQGMTADFLAAGEIDAQLLVAGSITTDKLSASVGQELEIGSNKSLLLYATVDGYRPSGGLQTQVSNGDGTYTPVKEGDSYIRIAAKEGNNPAYIDIMTGGIMNLQGSTMNLKAQTVGGQTTKSSINLAAGNEINLEASDINLRAKSSGSTKMPSSINLYADTKINMSTAEMNLNASSTMNVSASVLNLVGTSTSAKSALNIQSNSDLNITSTGSMNVKSGGNLQIESDGTFSLVAANFVVTKDGTIYARAGNIAGFDIVGTYNGTTKKWENQFLRTNSTTMSTTTAGIYLGYDGLNLGGKFKYNITNNYLTANIKKMTIGYYASGSAALIDLDATSANAGTISMAATSTVSISANSTVTISGGQSVNILSGTKVVDGKTQYGKVIIGNGTRPFTITADGTDAHIFNGVTSMTDVEHTGIYLGTNGIRLGKGVFNVNTSGKITATDADIMGEIKANTGRIGGKMVNNALTGGWHIESDMIWADNKTVVLSSAAIPSGQTATYRIYAGSVTASDANFYVMSDGTLKAAKGSIAGWTITADTIKSKDSKTGMFVGIETDATKHSKEAAFWAGNDTASKANFYVTHGGILKATSATLNSATIYGNIYAAGGNIGATIEYNADGSVKSTTGGWSITADTLSNNSGKTGMAYTAGDTSIAFWAGNATPTSANFRVTNGGTLTAVNGVFNNASIDGTIEAVSGKIGPKWNSTKNVWEGGWDIANNLMSSGAGTTYVGISSDKDTDYAFWAGNTAAASANFSVKRDGTLYAKNGKFEGEIQATTGTIGGWKILSDRIRSNDGDGLTGMASTTSSSGITFWAGGSYKTGTHGRAMDLDSTNFYVTAGGSLVARSANVNGVIKATSLDISGTNVAFTVNSSGAITGLTFTSDKSKTAGFSFDANGAMKLSTASFDSLGSNSSGIYLTPTSVKIASTGTFELVSTNFEVTTAGVITAKSGTIGNWNIGTNLLYSGKDKSYQDQGQWVSTYVGLSSEDSNSYAIWCGSSKAEDAPFRVRRNGLVYLTKVVDLDDSDPPKEVVVDLGKYSLGKLQYSTVVSVGDDGTVKLSNGKTFKSAGSVTLDPAYGSEALPGVTVQSNYMNYDSTHNSMNLPLIIYLTNGKSTSGTFSFKDGPGDKFAYDHGWCKGFKAAANRVSFPTGNTSSNYFKFTAPTLTEPTAYNKYGDDRVGEYRIYQHFGSKDDYYVYVKGGVNSTTIAQLTPTSIYSGGVADGEAKFSSHADITPIGTTEYKFTYGRYCTAYYKDSSGNYKTIDSSPHYYYYSSSNLSGTTSLYKAGTKVTGLYTKS